MAKVRHPAVRTGIAFGLQLISGGVWAMVDPHFVAHHALGFIVAGSVICAIVWLWNEIRAFVAYERYGGRPPDEEGASRQGATGIKYGPSSRGGSDENSEFYGFGDGDIAIHDHGKSNKHLRPKVFREQKEKR